MPRVEGWGGPQGAENGSGVGVRSPLRELQKIKCPKNPQAEAWGYTDEARLRGLRGLQNINPPNVHVGAQALRPYIDGATLLIYERRFWRFYFLEFPK